MNDHDLTVRKHRRHVGVGLRASSWLPQRIGGRLARADAALTQILPADLDPDARYRARALVALVAVFNLAIFLNIPFDAAHHSWLAVVLQLFWGVATDVILYVGLKRGKVAAMGHLVTGVLVVNLTIIGHDKGGLVTTEVAWQSAALVLAALVLGPREAFLWMLAAIGTLFLHVSTFDPSHWHGPPVSFNNPVAYAVDLGTLYFSTWALATAFDRARAMFIRRLETRNEEMQRVLEHARDALLTIDRDGRIASERSRRANELLDSPAEGAMLWDVLASDPANAERVQWLELGWEGVLEDVLPREVALHQIPRRFELRGRTLDLEITVIDAANGTPTGALIVLHDVTEELARERAERARREILAVLEHLRTDPTSVSTFVTEIDRLVESAVHDTDTRALLRSIHTIKGNSALFGVESMAELCHAIEERAAQTDSVVPDNERALLAKRWSELSTELREWSGTLNNEHLVQVPKTDIAALRAALASGEPPASLVALTAGWDLSPVAAILDRVARQGQGQARKLGKDVELVVDVMPATLRVDTEALAPVLSSLVHAVNNALDHGIASRGSVVLRATREERTNGLLFEVADDGGGIDWDSVRAKAKALSLPAATDADLMTALLSDGFSTRNSVTTYSGRGVGLAAIRQAAEALGGTMTITSTSRGTRLQVRVPLEAATPSKLRRAA